MYGSVVVTVNVSEAAVLLLTVKLPINWSAPGDCENSDVVTPWIRYGITVPLATFWVVSVMTKVSVDWTKSLLELRVYTSTAFWTGVSVGPSTGGIITGWFTIVPDVGGVGFGTCVSPSLGS